ncbi:MAG: hypothetical protein KGM16_11235 [Bacteroidota bacterium]|nr:hypothetical protein [Bacteroidota bacterium]
MKNFFLVLLTSFLLLLFNSCKKTNSDLTGQWQWSYSRGGVATTTIKPGANEKDILVINSDSSYNWMTYGTITSNGRYSITFDTTYGRIIHFIPAFLGDPNGEIYTIQNKQLVLRDYMVSDGFTHYFDRVK